MNSRTFASKSRTVAAKPKTKAPSTKHQEPKGKIMTLGDLHKEEFDEKPTKPKRMPKADNPFTKKPAPKGPGARHGPIKIGQSQDPDKWRCKICSFLNEDYEDICKMCQSEKGEERRRDRSEDDQEEEY